MLLYERHKSTNPSGLTGPSPYVIPGGASEHIQPANRLMMSYDRLRDQRFKTQCQSCVQENSARHAKRLPKTASGHFFCLPWTRHARLAQTVLLGRFPGSSHHPASVDRKCPVLGACSPLRDLPTYEDPLYTHAPKPESRQMCP